MRVAGPLAVAIAAAASIVGAHAEGFDLRELYRRSESLAQSLVAPRPDTGREIIAPPGNIDPKMAFEPPRPLGTMRIIHPPERPEQR